ncbi:snoaL-like domain protein [Planomonospora sphaerica]|uniref:SnoaL-like domain protein n=1 Tax=Planomonospora sphaerica TaxID=161355 RepID=A0A171DLZ4_9ACTN|nr:nuclear transport factor 2 family protein [Planomonospora sphaerica]GAT69938.1 snoaL-like domain protein [Planomonospora sphaerica]
MTGNLFRALCLVAVLTMPVTACSGESRSAESRSAESGATGSAASPVPARSGTPPAVHRALVDRFIETINAGDSGRVADTFASDARFDSVGRIYQGRDEIMDRFLIPEVIEAGGRYTLLGVTAGAGGRVIAEYDFATGHGGREHFAYDCSVENGRFADCVGRYV